MSWSVLPRCWTRSTLLLTAGEPASPGTSRMNGSSRPPRSKAQQLGVPLAVYSSNVINRASYGQVLQDIVHAVEEGRYRVNIDRTFELDEIRDAHRYMEANRAVGKLVVLTPDDSPRPRPQVTPVRGRQTP